MVKLSEDSRTLKSSKVWRKEEIRYVNKNLQAYHSGPQKYVSIGFEASIEKAKPEKLTEVLKKKSGQNIMDTLQYAIMAAETSASTAS